MEKEDLIKRMNELARRYPETKDENIKAQLAELSRQLPARISNPQGGIAAAKDSVTVGPRCRIPLPSMTPR